MEISQQKLLICTINVLIVIIKTQGMAYD
jgi:hypothetical protein